MRSHPNCLPAGTRIAEFEVTGLVGEGGFGIVYAARDTALQRDLALKEFMPTAIAGRVDGLHVAVRSAENQQKFEAGLQGFIKEARLLARFTHPALVKVYRFLEGNGTGYMAMRLYTGQTLAQRLARGETFDEAAMARTMLPIFDALEMLHREQVFHRDIAPDNIMLSEAGSVLLDFGSARHVIGEDQALTAVLKPTYSPVEQYAADGSMRQGAWTDVYAMGSVLYHMATGRPPVQAVSRLMSDPLRTIREVSGNAFSPAFSDGIAKAMAVRVEDRVQSMQALRELLGWRGRSAAASRPSNPPVWQPAAARPAPLQAGQRAMPTVSATLLARGIVESQRVLRRVQDHPAWAVSAGLLLVIGAALMVAWLW
ncbi:MAG: serine/threonine-protein kinase [Ramlibacter sp.]